MAKSDRYIFGIHAVLEAVEAGKDVDKVLVKRGSGSELLKKLLGYLAIQGDTGPAGSH